MELKIPIEVDFDDLKSLIDDLGQLQKYKLFESDKMVLVDVDDVANVLVKHIKAKEAQPKTGKWIYAEDEYGIDGYHCNQCGFFVPWDYTHKFINYIEDYHYCPNCGARMER